MTKTSGNNLKAGERLQELPELTASQESEARSRRRLLFLMFFGGERAAEELREIQDASTDAWRAAGGVSEVLQARGWRKSAENPQESMSNPYKSDRAPEKTTKIRRKSYTSIHLRPIAPRQGRRLFSGGRGAGRARLRAPRVLRAYDGLRGRGQRPGQAGAGGGGLEWSALLGRRAESPAGGGGEEGPAADALSEAPASEARWYMVECEQYVESNGA